MTIKQTIGLIAGALLTTISWVGDPALPKLTRVMQAYQALLVQSIIRTNKADRLPLKWRGQ